ncbi:aquaporin-5-like [Babylonia areolata]|uniref:aquaporin-5-like n=1 Tax=Babylonia areolata TaxID=304850 RepID=UPI003FCFF671
MSEPLTTPAAATAAEKDEDGQFATEGNGGQSSAANESSVPLTDTSTTDTSTTKQRKGPSPALLKTARMATSLEDITSLRLWKGIFAEFVGVLLLVLVGCGSCISLDRSPSSVVQISLCFGLSVATIVWNIAHISGGHINPAVTLALLATRKISLAKAVFFVIFQLVGAVVGAALLMAFTPEDFHKKLGATVVTDVLNPGQAVGVELFITFVLVFTVFASIDSRRRDLNGSTPLSIGLSVTMCHLFAVQYTGSSMNTARSFGPAVVTGFWDHHWVFWVGPITGGVAAGLVYEYLFAVNASLAKVRACMLTSDYDDDKIPAQKIKVRIVEEDPEAGLECVPLADADDDKTPLEEVKTTEAV